MKNLEVLHQYLAGTIKTNVQSRQHLHNRWRVVALHCIERLDSGQICPPPLVSLKHAVQVCHVEGLFTALSE